jgi:release factor glutamine methyltransferase
VEQSVIDFEPHSALFAGPSGLEVVTELLDDAIHLLRPGGWFISEIGYDHGDAVRQLLASRPGWDTPTLHRDLSGIERVVSVRSHPTIR